MFKKFRKNNNNTTATVEKMYMVHFFDGQCEVDTKMTESTLEKIKSLEYTKIYSITEC